MLFTLNSAIWKYLFTCAGAWGMYSLCGFEFTVVTLLALSIVNVNSKR